MSTLTFDNAPDVLTVPDVQALLQIKKAAVYTMIKRKQILAFRIGSAYRIPKKGLMESLEALAG